jgi:hypothetical protein
MLPPLLVALVVACVFASAASILFTWASGKSALWNMAFAAALVLAAAAGLLLAVVIIMRLANWSPAAR